MHKMNPAGASMSQTGETSGTGNDKSAEAFASLERGVFTALENYSNVHRGSGHYSMVSTHLYEHARDIILEYLGLKKSRYAVIFCSPSRAGSLKDKLKNGSHQSVSGSDIGLPLGVTAVAVKRNALPRGVPFQAGGGTTRLVSPRSVIWAGAPDKFEAGTPAIVNVIAFARALRLIKRYGKDIFRNVVPGSLTAADILYNDKLLNYSGQELLDELKQTLIGRGMPVPTAEGPRPFINLDNAASTPAFMPVWKAACQTWRQTRQVHEEVIREVRSVCAEMLGAPPAAYDVIFTSNTTEAINLAAKSMLTEPRNDIEPVILTTILEHTSNDLPWRTIPDVNFVRLKINNEGFPDLNEIESLLLEYNEKGRHGNKRIGLMAVCGSSNVLGIFNDLPEISRIVHKYGARLIVDAAQMVAHRKIAMEQWGIDYLTFSAHKAYAPFGAGVLLARKGLLGFSPAESELIRTSGEENATGIAALGKALLLIKRIGFDLIREEEQALTRKALLGLAKIPGLTIYGLKDPGSPGFARKGGVIVFAFKNMLSPRVARELAERGGIGVRYGCHCAHILIKYLVGVPPSLEWLQALIATLFPGLKFPGLVRVSFGIGNTEAEIDKLIHVLDDISRHPRSRSHKQVTRQIDEFIKAAADKVYEQL
ncbi:MAG: aminotransferase class V-fold PLP-dependent enzyme [Bacteroidales bacterium]|nr:aminotransferase class V-fold PLP-dependent enzyme [Bacteroidales bacterium]